MINGMLRRFTGVGISDFGCAFNAYRSDAVEPVLGAIGKQKFTKALVLSTGASVVEVDVGHAPRAGSSRYSPLRLIRTALAVLAGFWPQPIQWIGLLLGTISTLLALARLLGDRVLDRPLQLPGTPVRRRGGSVRPRRPGFILALVGWRVPQARFSGT
jgi:undecaprenyl-phosphate 4-deoxy-4-formamido-L-arabinose transferase